MATTITFKNNLQKLMFLATLSKESRKRMADVDPTGKVDALRCENPNKPIHALMGQYAADGATITND